MDKLISVIVPCYNSEKYIDRCINSLIHQSYKNFELIIIDDGSTDNSLGKIRHWSLFDNRINVITQKNLGRSTARNKGIENSRGDYITFVDSDDFVTSDYLFHLVKGVSQGQDISMVGSISIDNDSNVLSKEYDWKQKVENLTGKQGLSRVLSQNPDCEVWGKMFSRQLFNDIKFPDGMIYEDFLVCIKVLGIAQSVSNVACIDYFYYQRRNSTMNSPFNSKKMDIIEICEKVKVIVLNKYPSLKYQLLGRLFAAYANVWVQIENSDNKNDADKLWNKMMQCRKTILFKKLDNFKVYAGVYVSLFGKRVFRAVYNFVSKR
ncbi:glycosyltransferase family 2 protein [Companilactobacillus nantensis]|uniref:Exopolysaccharide biosynthesis protein, sugar transferase n=1 Tax=Companilactobacillus nantensis DSM 16982 TaxID=1423774 RepID=A0A0R1WBR0_9LACO|nr:glycosyltransferase family 2 protein [Companilactobacillus nantensis]KRM15287.1 exopolysaccharide biosynthesis protein, sugar transferase [Companilactobacillus nantensis DSM 16982]GEO64384.1 hypothetical protein LNA01_15670 [Companilactobacillus nantensis]